MANGVFNIAKGAVAEKFRDAASNGMVMLLQANEVESTLIDRDDVAALLAAAGNTEATFTNYARKTGLTGTVTVDDSNDRVDVDLPDQTFTAAGNGTNNTLTKLLVCYNQGAGDVNQIPLTHHDVSITTSGNDITFEFNVAGFFRAS